MHTHDGWGQTYNQFLAMRVIWEIQDGRHFQDGHLATPKSAFSHVFVVFYVFYIDLTIFYNTAYIHLRTNMKSIFGYEGSMKNGHHFQDGRLATPNNFIFTRICSFLCDFILYIWLYLLMLHGFHFQDWPTIAFSHIYICSFLCILYRFDCILHATHKHVDKHGMEFWLWW